MTIDKLIDSLQRCKSKINVGGEAEVFAQDTEDGMKPVDCITILDDEVFIYT